MPPRASRSQKSQNRRRAEDDEDEEEEDPRDDDVDMEEGRDDNHNDVFRKANDLVRLALFIEHKRTPIRRDEITKKVLGAKNKSFNLVFQQAQEILQTRFGMELVELKSRAAVEKDDDRENGRQATGIKKKSVAMGSKSWIVRSTLDSKLIAQAALHDEEIQTVENEDAPQDQDEEKVTTYGSILSWNQTDALAPVGVLYIILALVLVSGRVISDMDLRTNLKKLRLTPTDTIPLPPHSTNTSVTMETYLSQLIRQNFLDRSTIGDSGKGGAKGGGGAKKRGRGNEEEQGASTYEWRWGARAHAEVGEMGIAQFVAAFMVGGNEVDGQVEVVDARKQKNMDKVLGGIQRAAGGILGEA